TTQRKAQESTKNTKGHEEELRGTDWFKARLVQRSVACCSIAFLVCLGELVDSSLCLLFLCASPKECHLRSGWLFCAGQERHSALKKLGIGGGRDDPDRADRLRGDVAGACATVSYAGGACRGYGDGGCG